MWVETFVAATAFALGCWFLSRRRPTYVAVDVDLSVLGDSIRESVECYVKRRFPVTAWEEEAEAETEAEVEFREWLSGQPYEESLRHHIHWAWRAVNGLEPTGEAKKMEAAALLLRHKVPA